MTTRPAHHQWTPEDDAALVAALDAVDGLGRSVRPWHAVCGRLAPGLIVTPGAVACRYRRLQAMQKEARKEEEAREEVERAMAIVAESDAAATEAQVHESYAAPVVAPVMAQGSSHFRRLESLLLDVQARLIRIEEVWR